MVWWNFRNWRKYLSSWLANLDNLWPALLSLCPNLCFFIAGRINQLKSISLPDQFYQRYGSVAGAISAIYIFLLSSPAPYILSIGIIVNQITGLPHELSLVVITAISLSYIWNGGLKAVVRTDVLQFIVMFLGFTVLVFF